MSPVIGSRVDKGDGDEGWRRMDGDSKEKRPERDKVTTGSVFCDERCRSSPSKDFVFRVVQRARGVLLWMSEGERGPPGCSRPGTDRKVGVTGRQVGVTGEVITTRRTIRQLFRTSKRDSWNRER